MSLLLAGLGIHSKSHKHAAMCPLQPLGPCETASCMCWVESRPGLLPVAQGGHNHMDEALRPGAAAKDVASDVVPALPRGGNDGEHHGLDFADEGGVLRSALFVKLT